MHSNKRISEDDLVRAKEIYRNTFGKHFHMWQDEVLVEYEAYQIPKDVERRWCDEILNEIMNEICNSQNMKVKQHALFKYGQFANNFSDEIALIKMGTYLEKNSGKLDTFTIYMGVIYYMEDLHELLKCADADKESKVACIQMAQRLMQILKQELEKGIIISSDFYVNGKLPDYLSKEKLQIRIKDSLCEWKRKGIFSIA